MKLPREIRLFWVLSAILTFACVATMLFNYFVLKLPYPYNWPCLPFQRFTDLLVFQPLFHHFHELDFFQWSLKYPTRFMYPAPMAMFYELFYLAGSHGHSIASSHGEALALFLFLTGVPTAYLAVILKREMVKFGVAPRTAMLFLVSCFLISYPFWFELLLANLEMCVFVIVSFALLAYLRGHLYLAAFLIGVAGSMKIFPLIWLALFFTTRRYREMAFGVLTAIVANLVSLWALCPSLAVSYRGVQTNLAEFKVEYMLPFRPEETGFDHSLYGFFKAMAEMRHHVLIYERLSQYFVFMVLSGVILYFWRIRKLPLLNQIMALSILSILLPPTSHDYTLIHLYFPCALMILYLLDLNRRGEKTRHFTSVFVCFAILFSAESEVIITSGRSGQIKCITLVVLLVLSLTRRWHWEHLALSKENSASDLDPFAPRNPPGISTFWPPNVEDIS